MALLLKKSAPKPVPKSVPALVQAKKPVPVPDESAEDSSEEGELEEGTAPEEPEEAAEAPKLNKPAPKPAKKVPTFALLKGKAAQDAFAQDELRAELRNNSKDKTHRYFVKRDTNSDITFLDGKLVNGILDLPLAINEHQVNMNGSWNNFYLCTAEHDASTPCPICEGGANAALVVYFTVIDHTQWTSKDGTVHKDQVKLFVAKRDTVRLLMQYAIKRGGLRGCRFDVSRVGDKSPAVGSAFDFSEKLTEQQLVAKYKEKAVALNYEAEVAKAYICPSDLKKLGFGDMSTPVGAETVDADEYIL